MICRIRCHCGHNRSRIRVSSDGRTGSISVSSWYQQSMVSLILTLSVLTKATGTLTVTHIRLPTRRRLMSFSKLDTSSISLGYQLLGLGKSNLQWTQVMSPHENPIRRSQSSSYSRICIAVSVGWTSQWWMTQPRLPGRDLPQPKQVDRRRPNESRPATIGKESITLGQD